MPITLGNTNITGLGVGGLPVGTVTADNLSTTNKIIRFTRITYSGREIFPTSANYTYWTNALTKDRSDTSLYVQMHLSMRGNFSDCLVHECNYAGSSFFQGTMPYDAGMSANSRPFISTYFLTGVTNTGSNTISFRWRTANGATGDRPAVIWNPNSSDDARYTQEYSAIHVWEIL